MEMEGSNSFSHRLLRRFVPSQIPRGVKRRAPQLRSRASQHMLRVLEFLIQGKLANDEGNVAPMKMKRHPDLALVLQTAHHCHELLADAHLCHVIIGGLAVYLHGDTERKPRDVDLLIGPGDVDAIGETLTSAQYTWHNFRKAYCSPLGVRTEPHWNGKKSRGRTLHLPDPTAIAVDFIDGLPVIALTPLIESKLECELQSESGKACESKHRNDVLTLIRIHNLDESYADNLAGPFQGLFRQLVGQSRLLSE